MHCFALICIVLHSFALFCTQLHCFALNCTDGRTKLMHLLMRLGHLGSPWAGAVVVVLGQPLGRCRAITDESLGTSAAGRSQSLLVLSWPHLWLFVDLICAGKLLLALPQIWVNYASWCAWSRVYIVCSHIFMSLCFPKRLFLWKSRDSLVCTYSTISK